MKNEIKYNASDEVKEKICLWQSWLRDERRYSVHTLDAYARDLSLFLNFLSEYNNKTATLKALQKADVRTFRAFLSNRNAKCIEKSSTAREISALKNFYYWLSKNNIIDNTALSIIYMPKQGKYRPKAIDVDDTFNVLDIAKDFSKQEWQGLRDVAILTILYGCGLRNSEALSLNM